MSVVRILIWNLADSKTTIAELLDQLPAAAEGDVWIGNDLQERFGLVSTNDELPELAQVRELIGKDPEIAEEFDVLGSGLAFGQADEA